MVSACAALALDFCARSEFSTLLRLMASVRENSIIKPAVRAYTLYSGGGRRIRPGRLVYLTRARRLSTIEGRRGAAASAGCATTAMIVRIACL